MPSQFIQECPILLPSLANAEKIVPSKFIPCYEWFLENTGKTIDRLPHRMVNRPNTPIPLSRDSGIYVPGKVHVSYDGNRRYALSVHSSGTSRYADQRPISLADKTWVLDYAAQDGIDTGQAYNEALFNCLEDGVPVGVMFKQATGYLVLGLAFIERYNSASRTFTLHGPVTKATEARGAFAAQGLDELSSDQRDLLLEYNGEDQRRIVMAQQVRREQQGRFRNELLEAYSGACAISGTNVPEVLQAAHINPYRGRGSQVVSNGILLRADLHLLYDAHLISVEPDSLSVSLSERLARSTYLQYNGRHLSEPTHAPLAPNKDLLAAHYEQFRQENQVLVA